MQEDAVMLHGKRIFISLLWQESTRIVTVTDYLWLKELVFCDRGNVLLPLTRWDRRALTTNPHDPH